MSCPAASTFPPAVGDRVPDVLCGVLADANDGAHVGGFRSRGQVDALFRGDKDPSTIRFACHGQGVPGSPMSYCACVIWRARRDADRAGRREMRDTEATRMQAGPDPRVADALGSLTDGPRRYHPNSAGVIERVN